MRSIFIALLLGLLILPFLKTPMTAEADNGRMLIVVIEPPANFSATAGKLGYRIGAVFELKELSMKAVKVLAPKGHSIDAASSELEKHFPDIVVDGSEV